MSRTPPQFNPEIHAPLRLRITALLAPVASLEFGFLQDELGVSASVLSKHLSRLETVGYVQFTKTAKKGHLHTWVSMTPNGHAAFSAHVRFLEQIVAAEGAASDRKKLPDAVPVFSGGTPAKGDTPVEGGAKPI
ncbi:MAG: transcriptional regulator [Bifidobacteriaceae bacterium]|jgi:DNA-binding MarR family transcriptional regulator|nr:transcriptional regulator [Bifidobacteriaceae bacterium]